MIFVNIIKKLAFITYVLSITYCKAQTSVGFSLGISSNSMLTNISTQSFTELKPEIGYTISIPIKHKINNQFLISISPTLIQKNYSTLRTGAFKGIFEKHINNYLQFPLTGDILLYNKKRIHLSLSVGAYFSYWLFARIKGNIPDIFSVRDSSNGLNQNIETFTMAFYNEKYLFNPQKDRRIEFGGIAGLELSYNFNLCSQLFFLFDYYSSFTNQQNNYVTQAQKYNQTLVFLLGYAIGLHKCK